MKNKFITTHLLLSAAFICGIAPGTAISQTSAQNAAPAAPAAAAPLQLADNAPTRYEVKKGDTLWSIAARFLKSPWRWNEIWRMNKDQLRSPHKIYPGDVLVLQTGADGRPQLSVAQAAPVPERPTVKMSPTVRTTVIDTAAIPAIPPAIIDPFLTKPLIIEAGGLASSPKIVGGPDTRVVLASGYKVYATGLAESEGNLWQIYRPGRALSSPGQKDVLGYEAEYLGDAVVEKFGEVSTLVIVNSNKEIVIGDKLLQVPRERIVSYPPHAPDKAIEGRIIGMPTTLVESGRDAVLTLDVGTRDGIEVGHVLALYHQPPNVEAPDQKVGFFAFAKDRKTLALPPERIGLAFVFRVFDRVSYALVLNTNKQIELGDWVRRP